MPCSIDDILIGEIFKNDELGGYDNAEFAVIIDVVGSAVYYRVFPWTSIKYGCSIRTFSKRWTKV